MVILTAATTAMPAVRRRSWLNVVMAPTPAAAAVAVAAVVVPALDVARLRNAAMALTPVAAVEEAVVEADLALDAEV